MKRSIKILVIMAMVLTLILGSITAVLAVPYYNLDTGKVYTAEMLKPGNPAREELKGLAPDKIGINIGGKSYSYNNLVNKLAEIFGIDGIEGIQNFFADTKNLEEFEVEVPDEGEPGPGDELEVIEISAINKTTLEVTTSDGEKHTITKFSPSPLVPGLETEVSFTINGKDFVEKVTYDAGNLIRITNREDLIDASNNEKLQLDGTTVLRIEAEIINSDTGEVDKDFVGQAEFVSQYGLKAAHALTAFDNGKAVFNVSLPSKDEIANDKVTIVLKEHENQELRGLTSEPMNLTYYPYSPGGKPSEETRKAYNVDSVRSLDLADRVAVYVSNVAEDDKADIKKAILDQIKVYNNKELANDVKGIFEDQPAIDLVKIVEEKPLPGIYNSYVFTALVDLKDYNASGYDRIDQITGAALIDNQYNYYEIKKAPESKLIYLNERAPSINNKFMVKDSRVPRIEKVVAPKIVDGGIDESYLPAKTLVAEFNEAVSRISAENPENWVINGNKLSEADVDFIRVIDYDEEGTISGKSFNAYSAIATRKIGRPRTSVVIRLSHRAEREYLKGSENKPTDNLIQARSITDVAGLSDLSDNNKITTQNFIFEYTRPVSKPGLNIVMESPEQYVLELFEDLYLDNESGSPVDLAQVGLKVELLNTTSKTQVKLLDRDDYRIVGLDEEGRYILELTKDWTVLLEDLEGNPAYHNKWFRVTITDTIYDYYGNVIYDATIDKSEDNQPMYDEVQVPEDVTSPAIENLEFTGAENRNGTWTYTQSTVAPIFMEFDEPVQIVKYDENDGLISVMQPEFTPSLEQGDKVPTPTFEYVKVKATEDNPKYSEGKRIPGYIDEIITPVDEHDTKLHVKSTLELDLGTWKLVVREMSDDVGNTMKTEEHLFEVVKGKEDVVDGEDNIIDPYVIWAYADDDKLEEDGTYSDYVYILYSRQMHIDAIRAETYDINGKQLDQDADITSEDVVLYRQNCDSANKNYDKYYGLDANPIMNEWVGQLVTIKLPEDFIIGGDDIDGDRDDIMRKNVLTIPRSVKADDDGVEETIEELLFTNNGGSNTFELTFFNDEVYGPKYLDVCGLGGLYQPTLKYHTPMNHFNDQEAPNEDLFEDVKEALEEAFPNRVAIFNVLDEYFDGVIFDNMEMYVDDVIFENDDTQPNFGEVVLDTMEEIQFMIYAANLQVLENEFTDYTSGLDTDGNATQAEIDEAQRLLDEFLALGKATLPAANLPDFEAHVEGLQDDIDDIQDALDAMNDAIDEANDALAAYVAAGGDVEEEVYTNLEDALEADPKVLADIENATTALEEATDPLTAVTDAEAAQVAYLAAGGEETDAEYVAVQTLIDTPTTTEALIAATKALKEATRKLNFYADVIAETSPVGMANLLYEFEEYYYVDLTSAQRLDFASIFIDRVAEALEDETLDDYDDVETLYNGLDAERYLDVVGYYDRDTASEMMYELEDNELDLEILEDYADWAYAKKAKVAQAVFAGMPYDTWAEIEAAINAAVAGL